MPGVARLSSLLFLVVLAMSGCARARVSAADDDAGAVSPSPIAAPGDAAGVAPTDAPVTPAPAPPVASDPGCPAGSRRCPDGTCRANDVQACGAACQPCTGPPANAVATCDGTRCAAQCLRDFVACDNMCVSKLVPSCCDADATLDSDGNGVADCKENLLPGGQFTRDLGAWVNAVPEMGESTWTPMDARGQMGSGSLVVKTTAALPSRYAAAALPLNLPGGSYSFSLEFFIPGGQTGEGEAVLEMSTRDPEVATQTISLGKRSGVWVKANFTIAADPRSSERIFYLDARRGDATAPFTVYFDNIVLRKFF
jgi:hypothetical protein